MFKSYSNPKKTGWAGWFESPEGKATAFVGLDRKVVFMADIGLEQPGDAPPVVDPKTLL